MSVSDESLQLNVATDPVSSNTILSVASNLGHSIGCVTGNLEVVGELDAFETVVAGAVVSIPKSVVSSQAGVLLGGVKRWR